MAIEPVSTISSGFTQSTARVSINSSARSKSFKRILELSLLLIQNFGLSSSCISKDLRLMSDASTSFNLSSFSPMQHSPSPYGIIPCLTYFLSSVILKGNALTVPCNVIGVGNGCHSVILLDCTGLPFGDKVHKVMCFVLFKLSHSVSSSVIPMCVAVSSTSSPNISSQ